MGAATIKSDCGVTGVAVLWPRVVAILTDRAGLIPTQNIIDERVDPAKEARVV
jgi:hypothetical protein